MKAARELKHLRYIRREAAMACCLCCRCRCDWPSPIEAAFESVRRLRAFETQTELEFTHRGLLK